MTKGIIKNANRWVILLMTVAVMLVALALPASAQANSPEAHVGTFAELRTAMENAVVTQINLTDDITLPRGSITLNQNKSHLTINGNGFTITQHSSNATADVIRLTRSGNLTDITFQNINIVGRNNSGFVTVSSGAAFRNVTLTFDNVTYSGPQLVSSPDSRVILRDSDLTLAEGHLRKSGELVKATNIVLEGNVNIVNTAGGKGSTFRVFRASGSFVVAEDANVNVENGTTASKKTSGFVTFSNKNSTFTFADNSTFNYTGSGIFLTGKPVRLVYVGTLAQVHIETSGTLNTGGLFNVRGTMVVQEDSLVDIIALNNTRAKTSVIQFAKGSTLEVNNPESFFVFNSSRNNGKTGLAIGTGPCAKALRILYNEIESLEYWRLNSNPHTDLDDPTFDWRNDNGSDFCAFLTFTSKRVTNVGTQNYYGETAFNATTATLRDINVIRVSGGTESHEVTFDATGGTPTPPTQSIRNGRRVTEPNAPERADFYFVGWYTTPRGSDGARWDFARDVVIEEITLYARWTPTNPVTITYNRGARGVGDDYNSVVPLGSDYVIKAHTAVGIEPDDIYYYNYGVTFVFHSWNTEVGGAGMSFNVGDVITVSEDMVLHAIWVMVVVQPELYSEAEQGNHDEADVVFEDSPIDELVTDEYAVNDDVVYESEDVQYCDVSDVDDNNDNVETSPEGEYEEVYEESVNFNDLDSIDTDSETEE